MKRIIKFLIISIPTIFIFYKTCVFQKITHMSDDELAWLTSQKIGDTCIFYCSNNDFDTAIITKNYIENSLNPINKRTNIFITDEYIAGGSFVYIINKESDTLEIWTDIEKLDEKDSLYFNGNIGRRFAFEVKFEKYRKVAIGNDTLYDCFVYDNSNSHLSYQDPQKDSVSSFVWSKKYGLVQYSFNNDSIVYNRILNSNK